MLKRTRYPMVVLTLVAAIVLAGGCGSTESSKAGKTVIGVLLADTSDQFQVHLMGGIKEEGSRDGSVEVVTMDGKYDAGRQLQQAENLLAQGVGALVLMAVDSQAAVPILSLAEKSRTPVVLVNRRLPNQEMARAYVGSEDIMAGEIEMRAVAKALGGKGNLLILEGTYGHEPQIRRRKGYDNVLKEFPGLSVLASNTGKWYRNEAMAVVENWLQAHRDVQAVVAQNDEMAIGALKAIEDAGRLGKILVAGIDSTPEALKYVKQGKLNITVFQDAKGQGRTSMKVARDVAQGRPIQKEYLIPFELVTLDKVEDFEKRYR